MKKSIVLLALALSSSLAQADAGLPESFGQLGFSLLHAQKAENGNLFFSPYSLSAALSMASAGAKGETLKQMQQVLHFTGFDSHAGFRALQKSLAESGKNITILTANRLFGQSGESYSPKFQALLKKDYGASLDPLDFAGNPETARSTINSWVEENTQKRIQNLLPKGSITSSTDLVLANAVYFKAPWAMPFKKPATKKAPFHLEDGSTLPADFLAQYGRFDYAETADFQLLRLPYQGGAAMVILLPKEGKTLSSLLPSLSAPSLAALEKSMDSEQVNVKLPKFRLEYARSYEDLLAALGMPLAFEPVQADFHGMRKLRKNEHLFISKVAHKAFVAVDEEGTEAAAATAVVMGKAMAFRLPGKPVSFTADHPFLFWIEQRPSNAMLFLGRLMNPPPSASSNASATAP